MQTFHVSYGPIHKTANTLKQAREIARSVSKATLYQIEIISRGDVVETLVPKIDHSGRVSFRTVRPIRAGKL